MDFEVELELGWRLEFNKDEVLFSRFFERKIIVIKSIFKLKFEEV